MQIIREGSKGIMETTIRVMASVGLLFGTLVMPAEAAPLTRQTDIEEKAAELERSSNRGDTIAFQVYGRLNRVLLGADNSTDPEHGDINKNISKKISGYLVEIEVKNIRNKDLLLPRQNSFYIDSHRLGEINVCGYNPALALKTIDVALCISSSCPGNVNFSSPTLKK
jgi:hypothetical protein